MSFEDIELPEENTDLPEEDINNEEDHITKIIIPIS